MANIIGYNIYVDGVKYNDNPLRTFRHLVTGLTNDVEYEFTVRAVDEFGNETGDSVAVFETPEGSVTSLAGATLEYTLNVSYNIRSVCFSDSGSKMFVLEQASPGALHSYDLSMAYYLRDEPVIADTLPLSDTPNDMYFSPNGTILFTIGSTLKKYACSTPWDITSAEQIGEIADLGTAQGIDFSLHGLKMFVAIGSRINEYDLPAPWSINHKKLNAFTAWSGQSARGLTITSNGARFYIPSEFNRFRELIREISLTVPYSLGDPLSVNIDYNITTNEVWRSVAFSNTNDKMFLAITNPFSIKEYSL